jgi:hypothetical protein
MSEKLRKVGGALTGLATGATFYSLYLTIQDQSTKALLETYRSQHEAWGRTVTQLSDDNRLSEIRKARYLRDTEIRVDSLQKKLDLMRELRELKKETATQLISKEQVDWAKEIEEDLAELNKLAQDYKSFSASGSESSSQLVSDSTVSGSGSKSQLIDSFNDSLVEELQQLANSYWDWVHNLSIMQQFAISHILAAITILFSLSSLVTIFYSDFLIKHFNLESKFPRLAKYLSLRRTFQQYYFFLNTAIIIFFLGLVIVFNLYLFSIS